MNVKSHCKAGVRFNRPSEGPIYREAFDCVGLTTIIISTLYMKYREN